MSTVLSIVVALAVTSYRRQHRRRALKEQYHTDGADIGLAEWSDDICRLSTWTPGKFGVDRIVNEAPNLKELYIYRNCSDAILEKVSQLKHLELLHIRDEAVRGDPVDVTDQGLAHIAELKSLKRLYLRDCPAITGEGMVHLSVLPELEELDMFKSPIGDEGVKHLAKVPRLRMLRLGDMAMTDEALLSLRSAPSLRVLNVGRGVTPGAIKEFERDTGVGVR